MWCPAVIIPRLGVEREATIVRMRMISASIVKGAPMITLLVIIVPTIILGMRSLLPSVRTLSRLIVVITIVVVTIVVL